MKVVHLAQLTSLCGGGGGGGGRAAGAGAGGGEGLGAMFREARLADAVLVLTGSAADDEMLGGPTRLV